MFWVIVLAGDAPEREEISPIFFFFKKGRNRQTSHQVLWTEGRTRRKDVSAVARVVFNTTVEHRGWRRMAGI